MNNFTADLEHQKAATAHLKARTANRQIVNTLLWLLILAGVAVLPAVVIAGWRWFL